MNTSPPHSQSFRFDNSYARLPPRFYVRQNPVPVRKPELIRLNRRLARQLGLDPDMLESPIGAEILAGNRVPLGAEPLAMAYAGHQFGGFVPELGDGRAILLGEVAGEGGMRRDIHLKGAGRTPFSRGGDGRSWIGPVLREYIVSEAMAALGIPTTRALAALTTGEAVMREHSLPGGVLARVASSHIRIGTFQYFAAREDVEAVRLLAEHVIARHYPEAAQAENPFLALLEAVIERQAALIAKWMAVGFIHGVMNTDNMSIAGETIDYGPCAYMDSYHPDMVFSSIDRGGRYAYANQPQIGQWNLSCLAYCLLPLIGPDEQTALDAVREKLDCFTGYYHAAREAGFAAKIGLPGHGDDAAGLADDLLACMADAGADFTLTFRRLCDLPARPDDEADAGFIALFEGAVEAADWLRKWRQALARQNRGDEVRQAAMRAVNPAYIPRNHRIEQAIDAALIGDYQLFETMNLVLSRPFDDQPEHADWQTPPLPEEIVHQTFCGT